MTGDGSQAADELAARPIMPHNIIEHDLVLYNDALGGLQQTPILHLEFDHPTITTSHRTYSLSYTYRIV